MRSYLVIESNEPLKEGFLTQYGITKITNGVPYASNSGAFNIVGGLKHLKCFDITGCDWPPHDEDFWAEITDPSELQRIWEGIRYSSFTGIRHDKTEQYSTVISNYENFTLEPGVHKVREPIGTYEYRSREKEIIAQTLHNNGVSDDIIGNVLKELKL